MIPAPSEPEIFCRSCSVPSTLPTRHLRRRRPRQKLPQLLWNNGPRNDKQMSPWKKNCKPTRGGLRVKKPRKMFSARSGPRGFFLDPRDKQAQRGGIHAHCLPWFCPGRRSPPRIGPRPTPAESVEPFFRAVETGVPVIDLRPKRHPAHPFVKLPQAPFPGSPRHFLSEPTPPSPSRRPVPPKLLVPPPTHQIPRNCESEAAPPRNHNGGQLFFASRGVVHPKDGRPALSPSPWMSWVDDMPPVGPPFLDSATGPRPRVSPRGPPGQPARRPDRTD